MTEAGFGALLRRYRLAAGLTQEELAERSGLSARGISDLERGARGLPRKDTLQLLLEALQLSVTDRAFLVEAAQRPLAVVSDGERRENLHGVPVPLTTFVGRETEIASVSALLHEPHVRILTLTGPGGTGKTRLALAVAQRMAAEFKDGVVFVPLAPLRDPAFVASAIGQLLGVRASAGQSLADRLKTHLASKHLLLILDNFEHLLPAATLVADLLASCHSLQVLTTSRSPLRLSGEHTFPVPPLSLPEPECLSTLDELAQNEAVRLFVARVEAAKPDFALTEANAASITEIVWRLDGLPLALELAAARVRVLSPSALLARLEHRLPLLTGGGQDLPDRQRTLRDTIAWSYDLLPPDEQSLFRHLGVFAGGWTLEAADTVARSDSHRDVLEPMTSLLEKSLIRHADHSDDEPRFTMLETIREFSLEQLQAGSDADAVRRSHAAWCVDLATHAESAVFGPEQALWLARLHREYDNLRAALRLARRKADDELLLQLAGLLGIFWQIHGHVAEGAGWVDPALDRGTSVAPGIRAQAFFTSGLLAWVSGDYARGIERCMASVALWQTLDNPWRVAFSLNVLGMLRGEQGDFAGARRDLEESLAICRAIGHKWGIGLGMFDLGKALTYEQDYAAAGSLIEESLVYFRATGDRWQIAEALADLGGVAQVQGDVDRVAALAVESLQLNREQGWLWYVPESLELLGGVALARGEFVRAARLLGTAAARREATGAVRQPVFRGPYAAHVALLRESLGADRFAESWTEGRGMALADALKDARAVVPALTEVVRPE